MDWSAEEDAEEPHSPMRRPTADPLPLSLPPADAPASGEEGSSSPPLPWFSAGSRSPLLPMCRTPWSRSPPLPCLPAAGGQHSGDENDDVENILASLRNGLLPPQDSGAGSSASFGGIWTRDEEVEEEKGVVGSFSIPETQGPPVFDVTEEVEVVGGDVKAPPSFSFPQLPAPPCVDAAEVIDAFAISEEAEFLDATMGANTGPRTEATKNELAWFADLCTDESKPVPPLDESAFGALERVSSGELHHGADARQRWIGSVPVPEFFISSGKASSSSLGHELPSCSETIMVPPPSLQPTMTNNNIAAACEFSSVDVTSTDNVSLCTGAMLPAASSSMPGQGQYLEPSPEEKEREERRVKKRENRQRARERYNEKKRNLRFDRKTVYGSRKASADTRNRDKGRFAKPSNGDQN